MHFNDEQKALFEYGEAVGKLHELRKNYRIKLESFIWAREIIDKKTCPKELMREKRDYLLNMYAIREWSSIVRQKRAKYQSFVKN